MCLLNAEAIKKHIGGETGEGTLASPKMDG